MSWSKEPPTKPGWYWWRYDWSCTAEIAHVVEDDEGPPGPVRLVVKRFTMRTVPADECRGQWHPVRPAGDVC